MLQMSTERSVVLVHNPSLPVGWDPNIKTQKADQHVTAVGGKAIRYSEICFYRAERE